MNRAGSRLFLLLSIATFASRGLVPLPAQTTSPQGPAPDQGADLFGALRSQAYSLERQLKNRMLGEVALMIDGGEVAKDDPRLLDLVAHVATESWDMPVTQGIGVINDFPDTRARAAQLLGVIGTAEARAVLFSILRREQNTEVLGPAAMAIAGIPTDDRQPTIDILAQRLLQMANTARPDHAFTYALVIAVRTLHEHGGAISDPDLYTALLAVSQGPYPGPIRQLAIDTVLEIRRSNTQGH